MKILREGDRGIALAPGVGRVEIVYRYQDLELDSGVTVANVLVGLREGIGEVLVVPAQSTPKIRAAREASKEATIEVRLPRELEDVLGLIAEHLHAPPAKLSPALVRFYLAEATRDSALARRLERLSLTPLASGPQRASIKVRCRRALLEDVDRLVRALPRTTRSDLVRGAIVAAKEDVLEGRRSTRADAIEALAVAV